MRTLNHMLEWNNIHHLEQCSLHLCLTHTCIPDSRLRNVSISLCLPVNLFELKCHMSEMITNSWKLHNIKYNYKWIQLFKQLMANGCEIKAIKYLGKLIFLGNSASSHIPAWLIISPLQHDTAVKDTHTLLFFVLFQTQMPFLSFLVTFLHLTPLTVKPNTLYGCLL